MINKLKIDNIWLNSKDFDMSPFIGESVLFNSRLKDGEVNFKPDMNGEMKVSFSSEGGNIFAYFTEEEYNSHFYEDKKGNLVSDLFWLSDCDEYIQFEITLRSAPTVRGKRRFTIKR